MILQGFGEVFGNTFGKTCADGIISAMSLMRIWPLFVVAAAIHAQTQTEVREAVTRSLPMLEHSAAAFVAKRGCVSCHHNILPILLLHMAEERGVEVDRSALHGVEQKTFRELRGPAALDTAVEATTLNDPTPNDSFLLMAAHAAGISPDAVTGVYAHRLVHWQRDGHWVTSDFRPPHSSSIFTASASAVRAIGLYLPPELHGEGEAAMEQARRWFAATRPASTEDAAFRLLGLVWASAAASAIEGARADLLRLQHTGGGWGELPGYAEDAYSTGESLFALQESGMPATAGAWRKGARFLISTQAVDGSWRVHTRMLSPADVSPKYFTTGFPYEKDEYISYAASCWAVMGLLEALPETSRAPGNRGWSRADNAGATERVALFGSAHQLRELLDGGLDPNTKSQGGVTLLMMAAPDADKVRLLVNRGAEGKADAMNIAAAYRGTAESVKALLEAGAEASSQALVFASMTGDLANVKLLLAAGANPDKALTSALTFGYAEVARALLDAGASSHVVESSGINLLHWAAITNRPQVIPLLVKAGVPVNVADKNGFTPLKYATTIDFGDTAVRDALLKAGAHQSRAH